MLRPILRLPARSAPQTLLRAGQRHQRRCINLAPPSKKPRSLKNKFARLGLAGGAVYWFANSDIQLFSKQEAHEHGYIGTEIYDVPDEAKLPTLESIADSRRHKQTATASSLPPPSSHTDRVTAPSQPSTPQAQQTLSREAAPPSPATPIASTPASSPAAADDSPSPASELEEEAASEGAFNEETGEINWDCPCLGGMAHGPCGGEFREAFSCFVYSKEEPKGVDCIDRFKGMQDCFRAHPDIYGSELTDDDLDEETEAALQDAAASDAAPALVANAPYSGASTTADIVPEHNLTVNPPASPKEMPVNQTGTTSQKGTMRDEGKIGKKTEEAKAAKKQVNDDFGAHKEQERSETDSIIPKAAMDTRGTNEGN